MSSTNSPEPDDLTARGDAVYERLFGAPPPVGEGPDPGFMAILRRVIFGDVFAVGDLSDADRELITVVVLSGLQCLPQLKAHVQAALHVGNSPVEVREAIYLCAPVIGFPRTLNAVGVLNEVLGHEAVSVPLPDQTAVAVTDRLAAGRAKQEPLYGSRMREVMAGLPEPFNDDVPRLLTEFFFGDFYTRSGLDLARRELLVLVLLATLGLLPQLPSHSAAAEKAGNSYERQLAALVQVGPYAGIPVAINAINTIRQARAAG